MLFDDPLVGTPPADDTGAQTHGRYRFQWECAARHCFAMLLGSDIVAIVCEWEEDFVVFYADRAPELVSVKHRELSQGPWTVNTLVREGGVAHLFDRWMRLDQRPCCLLVTNAGLKPGRDEADAFATACHACDEASLGRLGPLLARLLATDDLDDVVRFCCSLTIEAGVPGRDHLRDHHLERVVRPALVSLGLADSGAVGAYEAVVAAVENASRGGSASPLPLLDFIADPARLTADNTRRAMLARRLLHPDDIRALVVATSREDAVRLARPAVEPAPPTAMVQKLERGRVGPTTIEAAKRLRASWSELEARYRADLPGTDAELHDLRVRVHTIAAEAERAAQAGGEPYGVRMHTELEPRLGRDRLGRLPLFPLDDRHLLGLVYQLTDECAVWWSPPFALVEVTS
jgi:Cap4 dsDNA endonuclease